MAGIKATAIALTLSIPIGVSFLEHASAQIPCGERADILASLAEKYGERPVSRGLTGGGAVLEVIASEGGESWSILQTTPGGPTCLVSAGKAWAVVAPKKNEPGEGA